MRGITAVK